MRGPAWRGAPPMSFTPSFPWPSLPLAAHTLIIPAMLVPLHAGAAPEPDAIRAEPIPVPADAPRLRPPDQPPLQASAGVIFVNFDGADLQHGNDDATQNRTLLSNLAGPYAAYGDGEKRDAVMQALRIDWADYNVTITDTRPASGPYVMNMTGPSGAFPSNVLGIAPLDCFDSSTHSNVTYAFHSANDQFSATTTATTISQEVAHSFGLEHVSDPSNIMNPSNAGGDPSFKDQCTQVVGGSSCGSQHAAQCGSSSQQNSHAELMDLFGPAIADTASPLVTIESPVDGDEFEIGANFDIVVTAHDDVDISTVELLRDGEVVAEGSAEPYAWPVADIEAGTYTLIAQASDPAGNVGESPPVTFTVVPEAGAGEDDGDDGDDDPGDDDDAGEDGGESGDGDDDGDGPSLPPWGGPFGFDDAEVDGCGCTTNRDPAPLGMLGLLVLALGAVRRRD